MSAVCQFGLGDDDTGGLIDREGNRLWVFDVDGTREALLQRELPDQPDGQPAPRRRQTATAAGYTGRLRADRVMNRMVVQQSHTQEFLGSLPMPGNGHRGPLLLWAAQQVGRYADARQIPRARCLVRGDGEHGLLTQVEQIASQGEGFLVRCADYQLLDHPAVQAALAAGTTVEMIHPDSGMARHVFDAPEVVWSSPKGGTRTVRLVITRTTFPATKKHRVGHRIANEVFELFVTDRPPSSLHAADIVAVYLHRGQFEAALAQDERELPVGHWASNSLQGQRLWHLLGQWVWNLRIWLGRRVDAAVPPCRRTDFTTAVQTLPALVAVNLDDLRRAAEVVPTAPISSTAPRDLGTSASPPPASVPVEPVPTVPSRPPRAVEPLPPPSVPAEPASDSPKPPAPSPEPPSHDAASVLRFRRDDQGVVHCPAGHPMQLRELRPRVSGPRERHEVARAHCDPCPLRLACRGDHGVEAPATGRRIDLAVGAAEVAVRNGISGGARVSLRIATTPRVPPPWTPPSSATVPPPAGTSLEWRDTTAASARHALREALVSLRVEARSTRLPVAPAPVGLQTRAQRAHRRRDPLDHLQRNAAHGATRWTLRFHGLPPALAEHLGIKRIL